MTEKDSFTGDVYWKQEELVARFVAVQTDITAMVQSELTILDQVSGILNDNIYEDEYREGYRAAVKHYTEGLDSIFHRRFKDLIKEIEGTKVKDSKDKIDLKGL